VSPWGPATERVPASQTTRRRASRMARALLTASSARRRRHPPARPPAARRSGRPAPPGLPAGPGTPRQNSSSASRRAPGCFPSSLLGAPSSRRIARQEAAPRPSACQSRLRRRSRGRRSSGSTSVALRVPEPAPLAGCAGAGQPSAWPAGRRTRHDPAPAGRLRGGLRGRRPSGSSAAAFRVPGPAPLAGCAGAGQPSAWLARRRGGRAPPPRLVAVPGWMRPSGASWPGRQGLAFGGVIRRANSVILNPGES